ncbi:MAG TPA: MFS transporter [Segeticoccus sp.]|uniref:MFS transporter n=1 Tax=Segeticoccus sp. TaxID=2706531 RepID=UPI002D7E7F5F|nr:MFS transporter [Segeticoccus sp.]HET8601600.1 MFS transporter [Segeticoccus sp.]
MSAPEEGRDPNRWRALGVCLVAGFMALMDVSIVNVALPSIREGLHASTSDLQWIVSGYALTFGLVLVPSGRLGDARGRRLMFVAGVTLFTLSSVAAGLSPSPTALVVARLVQGIGGGLLSPQINGLIQQLFRGAERGKAFGLFGATVGVSTAIGPLLGGAIIKLLGTDTGWRFIFFVNLPVGIVCVLLAFRYLDARRGADRRREDLDPVGVVLLGAAVFSLLLPLVEERQWAGAAKWWLLLVGAVLLAGFALWERRHAGRGGTPLVDLNLFRLESYSSGVTIGLLYFSGFTSIFFILTLYLQLGLGYTALLAGLTLTPFAVGSAGAAAVGGRIVTRYGRPLVALGLLVVLIGLALTDTVVSVRGGDPSWWIALPLLLAGIGSGLVISPNVTLTVSEVPVAQAGTAGGVLQTAQRIGTAAGIALIGSVFFGEVSSSHGDFARAASLGLRVTLVLVAIALAAAVVDVVASRRRGPDAD